MLQSKMEFFQLHPDEDLEDEIFPITDPEEGEIVERRYIRKNTRVIGVICWNENGCTITNGVVHISRNDGTAIHSDIRTLMIDRLFVVEKFGDIDFDRLILFPPLPKHFPPCPYCFKRNCHKWKVTEGGYQKLVKFKVHPIEH